MADPEKIDPIKNLQSILSLFNNPVTTSTTSPETSTETSQTNMSATQVQDQINLQVQNALAPIYQGDHTAGMYGSTVLPLAVAKTVASETASAIAKNAGTTRTVTSSGKTVTQAAPGPLSSSRIGDTAGSLLLAQIGAPLLKKFGKPLTDSISNAVNGAADSILPTDATAGAPGNLADSGMDLFPSQAAAATGGESDIASSILGDTGTELFGSGVTDVGLDQIGSAGSDFFKSLAGDLGFADGGYVDRHVATSNISPASAGAPVIFAGGEIAPVSVRTVGETARARLVEELIAAGVSDGSAGSTAPTSAPSTPGNSNIGMGNLAMSIAGKAMGPIGSIVAQALTGTKSVQAQVLSDLLGNIFGSNAASDPATQAAEPSDQGMSTVSPQGNPMSTTAALSSDNSLSNAALGAMSDSPAPSSSDAGESMATGGQVRGPGTGTSDSIAATLSDGEYVIDAKTVAALGPEFFQAIQAHFNPKAIAGQAARGRL
jgi:hypothetical protein